MTTSGVSTWTENRDDIIIRALQKVHAISFGDIPRPSQMDGAADILNSIVKNLQLKGIRLWTVEQATQVLQTSSVVLGSDGNMYTCHKTHTSSPTTQPVSGAEWSTYWTLAGTGGGAWVDATAYTSIADFTVAADTLGIDNMFYRFNDTDFPIGSLGRLEYARIGLKHWFGRPHKFWLEKTLANKTVTLYPIPDDGTYMIHYQRIRKLEDFVIGGNDADFPTQWISPLIYRLAAELSEDYSLSLPERNYLNSKAGIALKEIMKDDDGEYIDEEFSAPAYRQR